MNYIYKTEKKTLKLCSRSRLRLQKLWFRNGFGPSCSRKTIRLRSETFGADFFSEWGANFGAGFFRSQSRNLAPKFAVYAASLFRANFSLSTPFVWLSKLFLSAILCTVRLAVRVSRWPSWLSRRFVCLSRMVVCLSVVFLGILIVLSVCFACMFDSVNTAQLSRLQMMRSMKNNLCRKNFGRFWRHWIEMITSYIKKKNKVFGSICPRYKQCKCHLIKR